MGTEPVENAHPARQRSQDQPMGSSLLFLSGALILFSSIYFTLAASSSRPLKVQTREAAAILLPKMDANSRGTISFVGGSLCAFVGICGIVTVLLSKRLIFMVFVCLLTLAVLANIGLIVWSGVQASLTIRDARGRSRSHVTTVYGNESTRESRNFTTYVNNIQRSAHCCGWSGIDGENLYTQSPWSKLANLNRTGQPRTLPESCCITATDECLSAQSVKEARDKGFVHKLDCIDSRIAVYMRFFVFVIILLVVGLIVQVFSLAWLMLCVVRDVMDCKAAAAADDGTAVAAFVAAAAVAAAASKKDAGQS